MLLNHRGTEHTEKKRVVRLDFVLSVSLWLISSGRHQLDDLLRRVGHRVAGDELEP